VVKVYSGFGFFLLASNLAKDRELLWIVSYLENASVAK